MHKFLSGALVSAALLISVGVTQQYSTKTVDPNILMNSVVSFSVYKDDVGLGKGSGVTIENGWVVSASHVFDPKANKIIALTKDGKEFEMDIVFRSATPDIAILKPKKARKNYSYSSFSCKPVTLGDDLISLGNPTVLNWVVTWGKVAKERLSKEEIGDYGIDSFIGDIVVASGMSGGPVFNKNGQVVGLNEAILTIPMNNGTPSGTGLSFITPGEAVCDALAKLKPSNG